MGNRKPTRRTISVRGLSYQRLKTYCERHEMSVSSWLEQVIELHMSQDGGEPEHHVLRPKDAPPMSGVNTW